MEKKVARRCKLGFSEFLRESREDLRPARAAAMQSRTAK